LSVSDAADAQVPTQLASRAVPAARYRIALVGHTVAGIETQFRNVSKVAATMPGVEPVIVAVSPYRADDVLERRFKFLSSATRGTLRSLGATNRLFALGDMDGLWTQVDISLLPWLIAGAPFRKVPIVYSFDSTPVLLRQFGRHYEVAVTRSRAKRAVRERGLRYFYSRVTLFNAWSGWAARSLERDYGIPRARIEVLPPGVDVEFWCPSSQPEHRQVNGDGPSRLLFVGGDFERKGGDLLLQVFNERFRGRVEIDMVTRTGLEDQGPGVRVHTGLSPNDPRLVALYRAADIFVLPTRADCFSMAALEAMASGVPPIICPVGGIAEMFEPGREGLFVEPDSGRDLANAIETLIEDREKRRSMGLASRALAVHHYDAAVNTRKLLARLLTVCDDQKRRRRIA
jgi:glycosyltransferase involved in cell wall biosynthesis